MPHPNPAWLDRTWVQGNYLALCTTEKAFLKAVKQLKVPHWKVNSWVSAGANATTHIFKNASEPADACIVCINIKEGVAPTQVASILVHEAVHVFQDYCKDIGEDNPSAEFEAYAIQNICQALFDAYKETLK